MDVPSEVARMMDAGALAIVVSGTLIATAARCGWRDLSAAFAALPGLARSQFDEAANRTAIARTLRAIDSEGRRTADVPLPPDPSLARLVEIYLRTGSLDALHSARRAERAAREVERTRGVRAFEYAGELAPVFGLVGTLYAITGLSGALTTSPVETAMASIATAVLSSLYGVLTAHLVCIPLARAIERRGMREESAREALVEWLAGHVGELAIERAQRLHGSGNESACEYGHVRTLG